MDTLIDFDTWLLLGINGAHLDWLDPVVRNLTRSRPWILMYVVIAGMVWWRYGWRRALVLIAATGIAVGLSDMVCAHLIRPAVGRLRPTNPDNEISAMVHLVNGYRSGTYGFPSCHAANTMALAVITSLIYRHRAYTLYIVAWSLLQCYTRMYLGVHYPGDILVGATVGALIALGVYAVARRLVDMRTDINEKAGSWPAIVTGVLIVAVTAAVSL